MKRNWKADGRSKALRDAKLNEIERAHQERDDARTELGTTLAAIADALGPFNLHATKVVDSVRALVKKHAKAKGRKPRTHSGDDWYPTRKHMLDELDQVRAQRDEALAEKAMSDDAIVAANHALGPHRAQRQFLDDAIALLRERYEGLERVARMSDEVGSSRPSVSWTLSPSNQRISFDEELVLGMIASHYRVIESLRQHLGIARKDAERARAGEKDAGEQIRKIEVELAEVRRGSDARARRAAREGIGAGWAEACGKRNPAKAVFPTVSAEAIVERIVGASANAATAGPIEMQPFVQHANVAGDSPRFEIVQVSKAAKAARRRKR